MSIRQLVRLAGLTVCGWFFTAGAVGAQTIDGSARDRQNRPIPGLSVRLVTPGGGALGAPTTTDAKGLFSLLVPAGAPLEIELIAGGGVDGNGIARPPITYAQLNGTQSSTVGAIVPTMEEMYPPGYHAPTEYHADCVDCARGHRLFRGRFRR